jgi:hypothetical protein
MFSLEWLCSWHLVGGLGWGLWYSGSRGNVSDALSAYIGVRDPLADSSCLCNIWRHPSLYRSRDHLGGAAWPEQKKSKLSCLSAVVEDAHSKGIIFERERERMFSLRKPLLRDGKRAPRSDFRVAYLSLSVSSASSAPHGRQAARSLVAALVWTTACGPSCVVDPSMQAAPSHCPAAVEPVQDASSELTQLSLTYRRANCIKSVLEKLGGP